MEKDNLRLILKEYDKNKLLYEQFSKSVEYLISNLVLINEIDIHNISSRTKDRSSLINKVKRKQNKYSSIDQITDISGTRIIVFFESQIDKIAELISSNFVVDKLNSIDKRKKEYDRFGYLSLHYVVSFSDERLALPEYQAFRGLKTEIQIRSILQHAWAEIEHDLGYKGKETIPLSLKRNFSRVAALLETADLEFSKLRELIKDYEESIDQRIQDDPDNVTLDLASLTSFIANNKVLAKVDKEMGKATNTKIEDLGVDNSEYLKEFAFLNINSIETLTELLEENRKQIIKFATHFAGITPETEGAVFTPGSCLFYLDYLLVLKREDSKLLSEFVSRFRYIGDEGPDVTIKRALDSYKKTIDSKK